MIEENSFRTGKHFFAKGRETRFVNYSTDLQYELDVLHYDIDLKLFPELKRIESEVIITATPVSKKLSQADFNLYDNLKIHSIQLNGEAVKYFHKGTKLSLKDVNIAVNDTVKIKIKYSGTPQKLGLSSFAFGKINGRSLTYTLNEPNNASTWLACNDIPTDKASMKIRIENEQQFVSVSNGVLISEKKNGKRKSFTWETRYPIATYLICFYSGPYVQLNDKYIDANDDTLALNYYVLPEDVDEAKIDFEDHAIYLEVFENIFGEYPFKKEKYGVAQFLWQLGAMEHQTITGIGSKLVTGKKLFSDVLIHELAHHWWGNAITPSSWNDIWLNEAFSTYSEALYFEQVAGKSALISTMDDKFDDNFTGTVFEPDDLFNSTVYNKGAWILHMLRYEMGDSIFFKFLKNYYKEFRYKNISTEEFIKFCEDESDLNLAQFFDQWIFSGEGIPTINYKYRIVRRNGTNYLDIILTQQAKDIIYELPIDIQIITSADSQIFERVTFSDEQMTFSFPFDGKFIKLNIDPERKILAKFEAREND